MSKTLARCLALGLAVFGLLGWLLGVAPAAETATRFALIVSNAAYPDNDEPLRTPINDGRTLAEALQRHGFAVQTVENATATAGADALKQFLATIKPGSIAFVFFSGIAIEVANKNYLIPVDARIWGEADVLRAGISVDQIMHDLADRGASAQAMVLDAARRNPFERRFRSVPAGLASLAALPGTLSLSAAAAGTLADDDPAASSSVFVTELVKALNTPGLDAEQAFSQCRDAVAARTRDQQTPALVSGLDVPFSFDPDQGTAVAPRPASAPPAPQSGVEPAVQAPVSVAKAEPAAPPAPAPPPVPAPAPAPVAPAASQQAVAATPSTATPEPASNEAPLSAEEKVHQAELNRRISRDPRDQDAFFERGRLLAQHGSYSLALLDLDRAVSLNPNDADALNNRCWTRTMLNQLQTALDDCDRALKLRPDFADAHDSRGLLLMKRGTTEAALADYDAAIRLDPKQSSALYGRGIAKLRLGRRQEAEKDISSALALDPEIESDYARYDLK